MFKTIKIWWTGRKERRERKLWPERQIIVTFNDKNITAKYPHGKEERASWETLKEIAIYTNDLGPWQADVWFVISSESGVCRYPQGATGEKEALDFILEIDGFDENTFIKAMGCTSNAEFICWKNQ